MGYDCHLHVVPMDMLASFAPWFLSSDEAITVAGHSLLGRRDEVLAAIDKDPEGGARALLDLMLRYTTREAPHQYVRGFCLSVWDWPAEFVGADLPPLPGWVNGCDVLPWLADVLEAHPSLATDTARAALRGPFRENYDVGCFVPAERVPELRAFVEDALDKCPEQDTQLHPLLDTLCLAELEGMAYWEATDIPVDNRNVEWFDRIRTVPREAQSWSPAAENVDVIYLGGHDRVFVAERMPGDAIHVYEVDLNGSPPSKRELFQAPYCTPSRAELPDGSIGILSEDGRVDVIRPDGSVQTLTEARERGGGDIHPFGDRFLVAPLVYAADRGWIPWTVSLQGEVQDWNIVDVAAQEGIELSARYMTQAAVFPFGDGSHLLRWQERLYRVQDGRLSRIGIAVVQRPDRKRGESEPEPTFYNPEPGRVCFVSGDSVVCVDTQGAISRPFRKAEKITRVAQGPSGTVLLTCRGRRKGAAFLVGLEGGRVVPIGNDLIEGGREETSGFGYSPTAKAVFSVRRRGPSFVVPWSLIQAKLPKT